jgi:cell division protein FtsI/penicillin-binding protein 2
MRGSRPYVYVKHDCMLADETQRELSAIDGIVIETDANRIYPYDAVGSKVVGFVSRENAGLSGVELAYDHELRGTPGRATILRNGRYSADRYYEYVDKKPIDGKHVYLTIDATVQDIAETELHRAVDEFGAKGGAVIIMDVPTGDVLALAEAPSIPTRDSSSRADSLWTPHTVSHVYEPGSTFAGHCGGAPRQTRIDSFDAENGRADPLRGQRPAPASFSHDGRSVHVLEQHRDGESERLSAERRSLRLREALRLRRKDGRGTSRRIGRTRAAHRALVGAHARDDGIRTGSGGDAAAAPERVRRHRQRRRDDDAAPGQGCRGPAHW